MRATVIDSGAGIKDEDKPKLFRMFGSAKDETNKIKTEGIGLGLVISQLIVEHFGGSIGFESEYQKGSTFYFTFEIAEIDIEKDQIPRRAENRLSKVEKGGKPKREVMVEVSPLLRLMQHHKDRILIIDDEEFCLTSM